MYFAVIPVSKHSFSNELIDENSGNSIKCTLTITKFLFLNDKINGEIIKDGVIYKITCTEVNDNTYVINQSSHHYTNEGNDSFLLGFLSIDYEKNLITLLDISTVITSSKTGNTSAITTKYSIE